MTTHDMKINRLAHLYLGLFGATCCLLTAAEAYLLYDQTALFVWACGAMAASYWLERRMVRHAKRIRGQIRDAEARAQLHEALNSVFERIVDRTRHHQERRRAT